MDILSYMLRIVITRSNFGQRRRVSEEVERVKKIWDELDRIDSISLMQIESNWNSD